MKKISKISLHQVGVNVALVPLHQVDHHQQQRMRLQTRRMVIPLPVQMILFVFAKVVKVVLCKLFQNSEMA